ncbi:hypothetical protein [[Phormidium ambiguum] IAM M-71]|uniref:hypothetical protein n=1 Tax=[Phormidium ambiguum] IAM M-71 TaxID=454136 RepID=UPI0009367A6C|nr:hypothetical protein [Phormidium ambiguum]
MQINWNNKAIASASIGLTIASLSLILPAKADTVTARCDVYPKGEDRATSSAPCTFSQRQGFVSIQLQNGRRYELRPVGDRPGNYRDQNGQRAYRESGGLGDAGIIYRLANESIYVYWNEGSDNNQSTSSNSSPTPVTRIIRRTPNQITVQITEGEFKYSGVLTRTSGNTFIGSDGRVRVIYDRNTGRITIINAVTSTEFYNYIYSEVN